MIKKLAELPLNEWKDSKMTLHLMLQIIGKIRMKFMPRKNHWWYITEYLSPRGFTTGAIPYADGFEAFDITINLLDDRVELSTSRKEEAVIPISDGLSIAEFYRTLQKELERLDIHADIYAKPFDLPVEKPFAEITEYHHYDKTYVERFWRIMLWVDSVFKEFSGRFYGKTCPVHLYWHSLDLAVTRFSGREALPMPPSARLSDKDAYSHEVISFGFWAGDDNLPEPAFYSYTYPAPDGLDQQPLQPAEAEWIDNNGSPMALLRYEVLRKAEHPRKVVLEFLESSYVAGATLAGWDIDKLQVPSLSEM